MFNKHPCCSECEVYTVNIVRMNCRFRLFETIFVISEWSERFEVPLQIIECWVGSHRPLASSFASTIGLHLEIVKAQFKITRLINSICQRVSWSAIDRSSWIDQIVWFERFSKFCRRNSSWSFSLWWAYYGLWKHSWIRMSSEVLNLWIISLHQTFPHRWSSGKFTWIFQGNFHLEVPTCSNRVEFCWERRSFAIVKVVYCEQCSVLGDQFEWAHCTII